MKTPCRSRMAPPPRAFVDEAGLTNLRLGRGQPRDRYGVRRARDVGHAHPVAKLDGRGLTAVLPADADLHVRARPTTALDSRADQFADALLVQHGERIHGKNLLVEIEGQELPDVITTEAVGHLREVV